MHTNWHGRTGRGTHLRVVIEDGDPALAISDFAMYEQAGLEVVVCGGPGAAHPDGCPLLHDEPCDLLESADVVLHGLASPAIAAAVRRAHPEVGLVVRADLDGAAAAAGVEVLPASTSVSGQIRTLRRAGSRRGR